MAEEALRSLARGLPGIFASPDDREARGLALYGAWLAGAVLGTVGMSLHHKLCHTLGGTFNLPHAQTHTVVLPHVLAYNARSASHAMQRIARVLGTADAAHGMQAIARANGAPVALRDVGMAESDLDLAARVACANPYWNPRPVDEVSLRALLQDAFEGATPGMRTG
jgi:maleylacetate reductase